jgi:malate dehydrogenase (oxaloacetate-decarboxylating)
VGSDAFIGVSKGDLLKGEDIKQMADDSIVLAMANPIPEIMPDIAKSAGAAIVGTGRSDFPNQVNNSLCFPGIFRGVLDVQAQQITEGMSLAAATALAAIAEHQGIEPHAILPQINDREVPVRLAVATGLAAQAEGVARLSPSEEELEQMAREKIQNVHRSMELLMQSGVI